MVFRGKNNQTMDQVCSKVHEEGLTAPGHTVDYSMEQGSNPCR